VKLGIWEIDPATHSRHALHREERVWPESNCYVDLWTELLHAHGVEPLAGLGFTVAADLEGDQWTFAKFPLADLHALYGIEVFELNVWRPVVDHLAEHLALNRPLVVEVDAYCLPDTAGTSYRREHTKTSIAVQALDLDARRLGYFHNAGYYELEGDDFAGILRLDGPASGAEHLAPYVEVLKLDRGAPLTGDGLVSAAVDLLRAHLRRRPVVNPFRRFAERFGTDLAWLAGQPLSTFHAYAFATLRQFGASFELAALHLGWLERQGERGLARAASAFAEIAEGAKALQFRTARAVNTHRPLHATPALDAMAEWWDTATSILRARYGS
jgi:Domain of unknown function (DUF1839)